MERLYARYVPVRSSSLPAVLDWSPRAAEALAALLADELGRSACWVELRFRKDTIAADATAKLGGKGLLIGESPGVHRTELRGEQLRVAAADAKMSVPALPITAERTALDG
jgi:hypothetical protein